MTGGKDIKFSKTSFLLFLKLIFNLGYTLSSRTISLEFEADLLYTFYTDVILYAVCNLRLQYQASKFTTAIAAMTAENFVLAADSCFL